MKFRQRQILLSCGLLCFGMVIFLHTRTPDNNIAGVEDPSSRLENLNLRHRNNKKQDPHYPIDTLKNRHNFDDDVREAMDNVRNTMEDVKNSVKSIRDTVEGLKKSVDSVKGDSGEAKSEKDSRGEEAEVKNDKVDVWDKALDPKRGKFSPVWDSNRTSSANSDCPGLLRPQEMSEESQVFQKVDGGALSLEFSAFLDEDEGLVRVMGLSVARSESVFCLLWYHDGDGHDKDLVVVRGSLASLPESHSRRYSAHYIECPLPTTLNDNPSPNPPPYAVSLTRNDCRLSSNPSVPTNVIKVMTPPPPISKQGEHRFRRNFTVCVTALNYRYSKAYELVEMIELNRLLGAELLTFYVNSVGENVRRVLQWYASRGLVQLVAWDLPMQVDHWPPAKQQPDVHYFAQMASHNDCLNRHRGVSRYVVYQDLDEFIVPKKSTSWNQLIEDINQKSASAFIFRCVFFRKEWPQNSENYTGRAVADKYQSIVLSTDKREPTIFPTNHRAKYMVDPRKVQVVGIHNIWRYREVGGGDLRVKNVPPHVALLHHYRSWENPGDQAKAVRDTDMYRFKDALIARLQQRWTQLPSVPLDTPLSQYGQV